MRDHPQDRRLERHRGGLAADLRWHGGSWYCLPAGFGLICHSRGLPICLSRSPTPAWLLETWQGLLVRLVSSHVALQTFLSDHRSDGRSCACIRPYAGRCSHVEPVRDQPTPQRGSTAPASLALPTKDCRAVEDGRRFSATGLKVQVDQKDRRVVGIPLWPVIRRRSLGCAMG